MKRCPLGYDGSCDGICPDHGSCAAKTEPHDLPDFTPDGSDRFVPVGESKALVFYPDGTVRFRHVCARPSVTIIQAPLLAYGPAGPDHRGNMHTITEGPAGVTVRASIMCPDCGAHGFVTDSRWEA